MDKAKFTIGAFAIIFDEKNRVLLCHRRDYDLWNLPGGGVESGETPWQAVIRETKEETGLDVEIVKLKGIYVKPEKNDIVFSFICKQVGGKITLNEEADQIKYFALDDLPENTVLKQVKRIKDVFENKEDIYFATQYGKGAIELIKST